MVPILFIRHFGHTERHFMKPFIVSQVSYAFDSGSDSEVYLDS